MLTAQNLRETFDFQLLFENLSFCLNPGERKALVGPNGCGKTTPIRILAGLETPTWGYVSHNENLLIGYLPQSSESSPTLTINDIHAFYAGKTHALDVQITRIAEALANHPDDCLLQLQFDDLLHRIQSNEISRTSRIMKGLGLDDIDPSLPVVKLSGGQQTRLSLALVLLDDPQLLLLDEPTNHLDSSTRPILHPAFRR